MTPTPEQLRVFRMAEEEAAYGCCLSEDDMTASEICTAKQLVGLGYLFHEDDYFQITNEGQAAFAEFDERP